MTNEERILELAQSAYRVRNGRLNDVDEGEETTLFIADTIDWANQLVEELELEADWNYVRTNDYELATITDISADYVELPSTVQRLVVSPYRYLTIRQDGIIISSFKIVNPNQITDVTNPDTEDRCTVIGPKGARHLIFSRALNDTELNGKIVADTIFYMPRLSADDVSLLNTIEPYELLVLGIAKNATLPDIVQGGISPSLAQKYADLLAKAVTFNNATAAAYESDREDFSFIRGIF